MQEKIRNFSIIAHIDHGKSTLADRMLELTATVAKREMKEQVLDTMELERERGITIKLQPVTMEWRGYLLNLIDTPGHADFAYEVSRSLQACEGALLLVDASQGIEAQTLANVHAALEQDLKIIPVVNKIDLPAADIPRVTAEIAEVLGLPEEDILLTSGKTGAGVEEVLEAIIERIPSPKGEDAGASRALIFDSLFDPYRGVVAYVRIVDGVIKPGDRLKLMGSDKEAETLELGVLKPGQQPAKALSTGMVGYVVTGLKEVAEARVGDTITTAKAPAAEPLPGYREIQPVLFAGIFTEGGEDFAKLREALGKLVLSDASLSYEPERSPSLGFGFRCGFLGLLHLDIVRERLEREYNLDLVITAPSVNYQVVKTDGTTVDIHSPSELPDPSSIAEFKEPWVAVEIIGPAEYVGAVMKLLDERRGVFGNMEYLEKTRVLIKGELPLSQLVSDFYDALKSVTAGYASVSYQVLDYRAEVLVKVDILVAGDSVESLAFIIHKDEAYQVSGRILTKLKEIIPRAQFAVALQAAIGGKIIARETIPALRKDVTAKLYGGDVTRKRKLLEKQKKGKKKLKQVGAVQIPSDAFLSILKR